MSYNNHPYAGPAPQVKRLPWLIFLFLTAVFFLAFHDPSNAARAVDNQNPSADEIVAGASNYALGHRIALLSLGFAAIVSLVRYRANIHLRIDFPLGWLLLSFVAWAFISPVWAENLPWTLKSLASFGILCVAAVALVRRLSLREIILWIVFSTALFLFVGIVAEIFYGTFRPFAPGYRFMGTLHPAGQAIQCSLLVLSAVAAADLERRWRALFWACALVGFVGVIITNSRTELASVLIALVAYLVAVRSTRSKIAMAWSLGIISYVLLLFLGSGFLPGLKSAILLGRDDPGSVDTFTGRTILWKDLGYYIRQHPVLGYGYGGFWTPTHISAISSEEQWGVPNGHSAYVDCLLTLGEVGLVAYALVLLAGIWSAFGLYRRSQNSVFAFCGGLLVFCLLDGFLESEITEGGLLMYLCLVALVKLAFVSPLAHPSVARHWEP
jgi:exopolysaccharide production protein ExoQ